MQFGHRGELPEHDLLDARCTPVGGSGRRRRVPAELVSQPSRGPRHGRDRLSAQQQQLAAIMKSYWTNFAKRGFPTSFGTPFWPHYNGVTQQIQSLVPAHAADRDQFRRILQMRVLGSCVAAPPLNREPPYDSLRHQTLPERAAGLVRAPLALVGTPTIARRGNERPLPRLRR